LQFFIFSLEWEIAKLHFNTWSKIGGFIEKKDHRTEVDVISDEDIDVDTKSVERPTHPKSVLKPPTS